MHRFRGTLCLLIIMAMSLLLIGCQEKEPEVVLEGDEAWIADIDYIAEELPKLHKNLYFNKSEEAFRSDLEGLKEKVSIYSDDEMDIALMEIIISMGDTHTGYYYGNEDYYPLTLRWFKDGLFIVNTTEDNKDLLYGKVNTINGMTVDQVMDKLNPLFVGANHSYRKNKSRSILVRDKVTSYYGITSGGIMTVEATMPGGDTQKWDVATVPADSKQDYIKPIGAKRPLYLHHGDKNYWYTYLEEEKVLYMNYGRCREMKSLSMSEFTNRLWKVVEDNPVDKIVVDIRNNGGGSSPVLDPFIKELKESEFNVEDKLYVIIGKKSFSSAILNAMTFSSETNAVLLGETTGGAPNHYGEIKSFKLPHHNNKTITYSTKFFRNVANDEEGKTLEPDVVIENSFDDYINGEDAVLNYIIEQ